MHRRPAIRALLLSMFFLGNGQGIVQAQTPAAPASSEASQSGADVARATRLSRVTTWGYQLQKVVVDEIVASPFDLVVIDYSRNGMDSGRYSPDEIARMKVKPDGGRRIVLAYMSIGEAEDYRFYWDKSWVEPAPLMRGLDRASSTERETIATVRIPRLVAPGWLSHENPFWSGNFLVRFWYDGWQEIIMHGSESYLARVVDAGFDGAYLDRIDGYYGLRNDEKYSGNWMINFVVELTEIARMSRPDFLVFAQNAEELLRDERYRAAIDGIAKEDMIFGNAGDQVRNRRERIERTASKLKLAQDAGKTVLVVEYLQDEALRRSTEVELRDRGLIPYFGPRKLDRLEMPLPMRDPVAIAPSPAAPDVGSRSQPVKP